MKVKRILKLNIIAIILLANALISSASIKGESENTNKNEKKSISKLAQLKKDNFRWHFGTLGKIESAKKQIKYLRSERQKISRAIERLEFLAKAQKGEDDPQYSSLDLTDNDDNHKEESKE